MPKVTIIKVPKKQQGGQIPMPIDMINNHGTENGYVDSNHWFHSDYIKPIRPNANPDGIIIKDKRKIDGITGNIISNKGQLSKKINPDVTKNIIIEAKKQGVDPYTALAIAYQESGIGSTLKENPFYILGHGFGTDIDSTIPGSIKFLKDKFAYAKQLDKTNEADVLQAFNGYGKLKYKPDTKQDPSMGKKMYGIDISNKPLDLSKNPIYGKRIIDIRDNILKKDPTIQSLVNSDYKDNSNQQDLPKNETGGSMFKVKVTKVPSNYQQGGAVPETDGVPKGQGNAELEEGEVYQTQDGDLQKIAEGSGTHDEGGVEVDDAHKVLEDTADKRNDSDSKTLKMTPEEVKQVTGMDADRGLSHSKAFEKSWEYYEKQIDKIQKKIKKNVDAAKNGDIYAKASLDLNMKALTNIPSKGELFDKLFAHQELTKKIAGIDQKKKQQVGGAPSYATPDYQRNMMNQMDDEDANGYGTYQENQGQPPTIRAKVTKSPLADYSTYADDKFALKPFNNVYKYYHDNFGYNGDPNNIGAWQQWISKNSQTNPRLLDYLHTVPLTNKGRQLYGNSDPSTLTNDQLINQFQDNKYDFRAPRFQVPNGPDISDYPYATPPQSGPQPIMGSQQPPQGQPQRPNQGMPPRSKFNEPLHWYDVAGDINSLVNSGRVPTRYNPVNLQTPNVHLLDPRPELQAGQANYNALLNTLPKNGVGFSNLATIYAQKYGIDDKILGAYENQNKQKLDQQDQMHAQIANEQSQSDQQSRETYERKYLGSLEAQRQQRMTAFNGLMDKIAQNHKLNTEGNLIMSTINHYDQQGNFNGRGATFQNPTGRGSGPGGNQTIQYTDPKTGQQHTYMLAMIDGKGKMVRVN